jgi:zinc protease
MSKQARSICSRLLTLTLVFTLLSTLAAVSFTAKAETKPDTKKLSLLSLKSESPLITLRVVVRAGSAHDPIGKEGLAALTANILNDGGNQTLTYREILKKLYPMAATTNIGIDKEVVTFVGEVHKDHLVDFYRIFADNILKPRFDQAEFDRLRSDAVNYLEKTLRGNDDEELGKQALELELFRNHPYGHAVSGTVTSLKKLTLQDVKDFYKQHYTIDNIMIGTAGDLSDPFITLIKTEFAALPHAQVTAKQAPVETPNGVEITLIEKDTRASAISLGFPINLTRKDSDFYALLLANSFLGEHRTFNGLLMNNMRAKRGLNYGDYSYIEHFVQDGDSTFALPNTPRWQQYFSIWVRPVPNENRLFALRQAVWELDRFVQKGMTEKEFEATRKFMLNYSNLWVQTLSRRLGYRLDSKFYGIEDYISEIHHQLPKLTLSQVNAAIKKHLNARNLRAVVITSDAEALKQQLLNNTPSPIKYESQTPQDILDEDKQIEKYALPINKDRLRVVPVSQIFEK